MIFPKKNLIFLLVIVVFLIYYFELPEYLTLEFFKQQNNYLLIESQEYYWFSMFFYILLYCLVIALALPGAAALSLLGGFLFGTIFGTIYILIGAISGAVLSFLAIRFFAGTAFQKKYHYHLVRFNKELEESGAWYLLSLRLIPVFPFFLINILAGLTTISLFTFFWTTLLGIIPAALFFSFAGQQLRTIQMFSDLFSYKLLFTFILFAFIALLPVIYKKFYSYKNL